MFGYQAEPYLWFVPGDGVYRNTSSPATYLNEDRYGDVDMPAGTSASAEPAWEQVTTANTYAWHDHPPTGCRASIRQQWQPNPAANTSSSTSQSRFESATPTSQPRGAALASQRGVWPPVAALSVLVAVVAVVAVTIRPAADRWAPLARAGTAIVLVVVAAANLVRVVDDLDRYRTGVT